MKTKVQEKVLAGHKIGGLMVFLVIALYAGAVFGVLGLPAAFEGVRSRFLLIAPVFMCLLCAAAAEAVFVYMGRGHSYSALAVVLFAFLQLLIVIPQKKKRRTA